MPSTVNRKGIQAGLQELGVEKGDLLLAHTSLKSFGRVEGGADAVIDAMLEAVGPSGTVMVPTLSFQVLTNDPIRFSVLETPSSTGLVPEVFRKRPEVIRSHHPVSSTAAIGHHAEYVTGGHLGSPCDETSPYYRLADLGGKVVFFGAPLGSNSLFHCAEDIVLPEYLGFTTFEAEVVDAEGVTHILTRTRYDCADRGISRYIGKMEDVFLGQGLLKETTIGKSRTCLIDGMKNIEACCEVLRERPEFILSKWHR